MSRQATALGAVTAVLAALISQSTPVQAQTASERVLVMPFQVGSHDARSVWLGEAASVLLADELNAVGVPAITRDERRTAFDRLQVPPVPTLTGATMIRIAQLLKASHVVTGTVGLEGDQLVVTARSLALDSAKVLADAREQGPLTELFLVFGRVARRITPQSRRSPDSALRHPPLPAFESYIKGLLAETPATAEAYLDAALRADPTLDRARIALWEVFDDEGEHLKALEAASAVQAGSELTRGARFRRGLSQMNLRRYDDAFATLKALSDAEATPEVFNNLGVVQLRRGSTPATGVPTYYFTRAVEADETEPDYFFNLGYAYWLDHDPQAAIYWLREGLRRNPTDGDAHYVLAAALAAAGQPAESARERDLARRLSSTYDDWDKRPANDAVPKGLERVKSDVQLPHARRIERALVNAQSDQRELVAFHLERATRLAAQELDRDALEELNRVLFLMPYSAEAHQLLGRIHLRAGRVREAVDALNLAIWADESADAWALLAEAHLLSKDMDAAHNALDRALALAPGHVHAQELRAKLPPR